MTYAVLSDLHCHKWSLFSKTTVSGVNSRLEITLNEMKRAAEDLKDHGGDKMVIAGDIFHVRGSLDPEVLNPTQEALREVLNKGIDIYAIPGNHDLSGKEANKLGSSILTLENTLAAEMFEGQLRIISEPTLIETPGGRDFAFIPWCSSNEDLFEKAKKLVEDTKAQKLSHETDEEALQQTDLFIHAGIDGVLSNMPDHGLIAGDLAELGFGRVFAGHYHNHKDFGNGVYSIGATTHQTWGDVGTKAGYLLASEDDLSVEYRASHAPSFIDISGLDEDELDFTVPGNYARYRGASMTSAQVSELTEQLKIKGAIGVSIQASKADVATVRATAPKKTGATLDESVQSFVEKSAIIPAHINRDKVKLECNDILAAARTVSKDA